MAITVLEDSSNEYEKIIHLSDLHIRTGDPDRARYKEYSVVFLNLIETLKRNDLSKALILITGDLFHHKGKIEPAGIKLANQLFTQLLDIAPVLVICGNHDYRQDDPDIPDMIDTLLELYHTRLSSKKFPLYYLNKTGHYSINNIGFGLVDIRDALKSYNTCGRYENLPPFPSNETISHIQYQIALFHGSVAPKEVYERFKSFNGYPLEWFGNYPYILLGDIHRHQIHHTSTKTWGYPGSLIQQDFGEKMMDHGFLIWDLKTNNVEFQQVYNPYGLCTMKHHNDKWYIHSHKKEWYELEDILIHPMFPKTPMIRLINKESINDCMDLFNKHGIKPEKVQRWLMDTDPTVEDSLSLSLNPDTTSITYLEELNTPNKWIDYLKYISKNDYSTFILNPESLKLPTDCGTIKKYTERNDKIQKVIDEYNEHRIENIKQAYRVELVNLSWNYLMCYGENNFFDFSQLKDQIALLNGKNAMGKSSFLDIVCIALYGEATKMRHLVSGKKYTDKIIHDHRPSQKTAPGVKLMLRIQDELYEISRTFGTQSAKYKEHSIMQKDVTVSKIDDSSSSSSSPSLYQKSIIAEGNTSVERWIEAHIGSMESVLMSTMICQMDLNNFFHMKQEEQKTILDTALHLENVSLFGKILKESLLAHNDIQSQIKSSLEMLVSMKTPQSQSVDNEMTNDQTTYSMEDIEKQYLSEKKQFEKLLKQKEMWLTKIQHSNWKNIEIPDTIEEDYRVSKDDYDYKFKSDRYDVLESQLETSIRLEEKINQYVEQLEVYKSVSIYKDSDKHYDKWLKKKEKFIQAKPKCDVSEEWIQQTRNNYEEWVIKNNENNYPGITVLNKEKEDLFKDVPSKPLNAPRPKKLLEDYYLSYDSMEYDSILNEYSQHIKIKREPQSTLDQYNEWCNKYSKWKKSYPIIDVWTDKIKDETLKKLQQTNEKIQQNKKRSEELDQYKKDLEGIDKDMEMLKDLNFNPKCKSCQINPFNLKKQQLEERQTSLQEYCQKMTEYIDKIKPVNSLVALEEKKLNYEIQLQQYKEYLFEKEYYEKENTYWVECHQQIQQFNEWTIQYNQLKEKLKELEDKKLHYDWKKYEEWQHSYETFSKTYEKVQAYESEKEYWDKTMNELNTHEELIELYKVWKSEECIVEEKLEQFKKSIEKQQLQTDYQSILTEFNKVKDNLDELKELKKIKDSFKAYESMYAIYKVNELTLQLDPQKDKTDKLYETYLKNKQQEEINDSHNKQIKFYQEICDKITIRIESIKDLEINFMGDKTNTDGYKEWIYKNKVIPLLNKEMNMFLSLFEEFRFKMIYEKKQFLYMLEDRGNEPTLDKASGYQNFIISLAFRLALTRIGAIGQQLKHLFIDEGFTACDSSNIEKVPMLLKSILEYGKYHSILIMSHMDSVRECTNKMIHIERKDPFSYIRYGQEYPKIMDQLKIKKAKA